MARANDPVSLASLGLALLARDAGAAVAKPPPAKGAEPDKDACRTLIRSICAGKMPPSPDDKHLLQLAKKLALENVETTAVALAARVELDRDTSNAIANMQRPLTDGRPGFALLDRLDQLDEDVKRSVLEALATGTALRMGLLVQVGMERPLVERQLRVPEHIALALSGARALPPGCRVLDAREPLRSIAEAGARFARFLIGDPAVLVIRARDAEEGRSAALAVAKGMDRRAVLMPNEVVAGLLPWLFLDRAVPVWEVALGPGDRFKLPQDLDGPRIVITGLDGSIECNDGAPVAWTLPPASPEERIALWKKTLPAAEAEELGRTRRHGAARIEALSRTARALALREDQKAPSTAHVHRAARSVDAGLGSLAELLSDDVPDAALVLPGTLDRDLRQLLTRCLARERLVDSLGPSARARYHAGVRSLFVGPSGTGKTLAAAWLATKLELPLYRVDLAAVSSKYIGETEKNLSQLFARAETSEVVLLFDEADSMFGKRTEVKQSTDRFANAQTNYLLQRVESYEGIVILTSNSRTRFDTAFSRRLDVVIEFPHPAADDRRELWMRHLGKTEIDPRRINQLAATVDLAGGHIRNVVLAAAVLANATERKLSFEDLTVGLEAEYRKLGRAMPHGLTDEKKRQAEEKNPA